MEADIPDSETLDISDLIEDKFQILFVNNKDTICCYRTGVRVFPKWLQPIKT